jgi:hypothetical protein
MRRKVEELEQPPPGIRSVRQNETETEKPAQLLDAHSGPQSGESAQSPRRREPGQLNLLLSPPVDSCSASPGDPSHTESRSDANGSQGSECGPSVPEPGCDPEARSSSMGGMKTQMAQGSARPLGEASDAVHTSFAELSNGGATTLSASSLLQPRAASRHARCEASCDDGGGERAESRRRRRGISGSPPVPTLPRASTGSRTTHRNSGPPLPAGAGTRTNLALRIAHGASVGVDTDTPIISSVSTPSTTKYVIQWMRAGVWAPAGSR